MKPRMEHYVLKLYKVYINDDPVVDLGLFYDNVEFGETVFALIVISGERLQDHWSSGLLYIRFNYGVAYVCVFP